MGVKKVVFDGNDAKETVETTVLKEDVAGSAVGGGSLASQDRTSEQDIGETDYVAGVWSVRSSAAASSDDEEKSDDADGPGNIRSTDSTCSNSDSSKKDEGSTLKRIRML